ncbi:serine/threonine protein phosphatase [Bradyrhizobium sp. SSBR45G]|uniref:metallophosphoesterase n=1 Tax=unclassified Bradyrhizobium TaxID=2631580 RepID=UPI002342B3C6|nr:MULTISPECIES: metallophosphoesterase [unclassified Bradyrhizobium]GLH79759.1 serine/threonine protein phosphatase [Bradyrhizobium sp. SSBR45G]GLH87123.1 serine/threonine protein phosphatase [Bradyrhizobium sp. SSBR45R]
MRLHIVSDLHADIGGNAITEWTPPEADVVVVAGDAMAPGSHALRLVRRLYRDTSIPMIYVPGNHDYYSEGDRKVVARDPTLKTTRDTERARMREVAAELGIVLLDDEAVAIDGVRFVGSTLWSDLRASPRHMTFEDVEREARHNHNDFRLIKVDEGRSRDRWTVRRMLSAHQAARAFIERVLAEPHEGDTVVITHAAPSYRSLAGWDPSAPTTFREMDSLYASDLEYLMTGENAPALWIHGHVHHNMDYSVGATRVICNPRGYPPERGKRHRENPAFDPGLVVEIEPRPTQMMRIR